MSSATNLHPGLCSIHKPDSSLIPLDLGQGYTQPKPDTSPHDISTRNIELSSGSKSLGCLCSQHCRGWGYPGPHICSPASLRATQASGLLGKSSLKGCVTPELAGSIGPHVCSAHQVPWATYFRNKQRNIWGFGVKIKCKVIFTFWTHIFPVKPAEIC